MTIRKTAYETVACNGFAMKRTIDAIQQAFISGGIGYPSENEKAYKVDGNTNNITADIPAFAHPLLVPSAGVVESNDNGLRVVIDVRNFGVFDKSKFEYVVKNKIEYDLQSCRGSLNHIWINYNPNLLRDISPLAVGVYAAWVSENVSRRFALEPREQMDLGILSAIFYLTLFKEESVLTEDEVVKLTTLLNRTLKLNNEDVLAVFDKMTEANIVLHTVHDFCSAAAIVTNSVRLEELNPGVLFTILGGTWFGFNSREMIAVAIEHPPTWIAILVSAFNERGYHNSGIAKLTERSYFKEPSKLFIRSVMSLIQAH
jgi:hypothetical protein